MNDISIYGTIFKPELRYTADQKPIWKASLSMYTGKDIEGKYLPGVWWKVTAFGDLAEQLGTEISERARVTVTGKVEPPRVWVDKEGKERADNCVIARAVVQGNALMPEKAEEVW
jgi:single-stranded DNA-binding protein